MNSNLLTTFSYKDLLLKKIYYSVASCLISQFAILLLYVLIVNINIFHPFEWFLSTLKAFTFLSTWIFVLLFISIIFAQCIICAKDYVFMSVYCSTRFQQFLHIFSLHNFILLISHMIIGGVSVWQFLSLANGPYQHLITTMCKDSKYCLVDGTFFLILNGLWIGFYYYIKIHLSSKHLKFPVIQQRKLLQFRSNINRIIRKSISSALLPTIYFIIFYKLFNNHIRNNFGYSFEDNKNGSSLQLYFYCWWFSCLYFFNMNLMRLFFQLFLTETVDFPLVKENDNILTLQDAININNLPIIQYLSCLDLYLLSQWSFYRRRVFFTLSQPGGHPHNWNALIENILKYFTEYTDLLNKSNLVTPLKQINLQSDYQTLSTSINKYRNLRNMVHVDKTFDLLDESADQEGAQATENTNFQGLKLTLSKKFNNAIEFFKTIFGINYFFGELPQANIQKCLGNGQLIIWASQGIAELISASLKEDQYGIVQKDIPVIITSLVQLKQSLDKLNKLSILSKRSANDFNYKMKTALSSAVKRSLCNICLTFSNYLNDLGLRKDISQYLQSNIIIKAE